VDFGSKENMDTLEQSVLPVAGNIGLAIIFLWQWNEARKERIQAEKSKDELNNKVLRAFEENTRVNTEVKAALRENATASASLSQLVHDVLNRKDKDK
jgi:hypothetical protein